MCGIGLDVWCSITKFGFLVSNLSFIVAWKNISMQGLIAIDYRLSAAPINL